MRKNLSAKTALIFAVLLVFVYGIFGLPHGLGPDSWKSALANRIHLGLDLSGGTHLVLQVMVEEAVGAVTDNDDLRDEGQAQQRKADAERDVATKEAEAEKARAEAEAHEAEQRAHQNS
jgi:preprotein translocase subunit SecD